MYYGHPGGYVRGADNCKNYIFRNVAVIVYWTVFNRLVMQYVLQIRWVSIFVVNDAVSIKNYIASNDTD
jgi:hypothetical protein